MKIAPGTLSIYQFICASAVSFAVASVVRSQSDSALVNLPNPFCPIWYQQSQMPSHVSHISHTCRRNSWLSNHHLRSTRCADLFPLPLSKDSMPIFLCRLDAGWTVNLKSFMTRGCMPSLCMILPLSHGAISLAANLKIWGSTGSHCMI